MKEKKNLLDYFSEIPDFRKAQGRKHELPIVLIIAIMAIMSGYTWERAMWDFVKKNAKELRKYLKPKKWYLPSYQTIDLVLTKLWYEKIMEKFIEWMLQEKPDMLEQIAIDWKAIWWTVENPNNSRQKFISLVTAFRVKKKEVIWAKQIDNSKESEIPAVRELIKMLWLEWVVFTMDALHCQKETVKTIVETKNHYIIGVRWNQPKLKKSIEKEIKKKTSW